MDNTHKISFAMDMFAEPEFWAAVGQIVLIDILLGGDNAIVIALACRRLPPYQRNQAIFWGTFGAIALRILLLFFAVALLKIAFLKIVGGLLLLWIGVKLLVPEQKGEGHSVDSSTNMLGAIKTIIVADLVMSLDNVVAVAGAARDSLTLIVLGVLISVPIILWGSRLVLRLMDRFPVIITLGAALLGYIGGEMLAGDRAVQPRIGAEAPWLEYALPIACALLVVVLGRWLVARKAIEVPFEDLARDGGQPSPRGESECEK
jgi:YjbE family integral membrane protein